MIEVYVGIGSNLENPLAQVNQAIAALHQLPDSQYIKTSRLYRSTPMGPVDQPDYINAASLLTTTLTPLGLLDELQAIENRQGRVRTTRWGPRKIDLDLLLYGEKIINAERLTVPHPGLHERCFVLYPLQDINPALVIPGYGSLASLITHCPATGLERID